MCANTTPDVPIVHETIPGSTIPLPLSVDDLSNIPSYLVPPDTRKLALTSSATVPAQVELQSPTGGIDLFGMTGEHSETRSWEEVAAARPDVVVVMPCGYDAERALEEADSFADELETLGARRVDVGQGEAVGWEVLADPEGNEFCVLRPKASLIAFRDAPPS